MILAEEARSPSGQVLAGPGTKLTEKHVETFRTWGVVAVVLDPAGPQPPVLPPEKLLKIRRIVARHFAAQSLQHPAIQELYRLSVERQVVAELAP